MKISIQRSLLQTYIQALIFIAFFLQTPASAKVLYLPAEIQMYSEWCWAAVTGSILAYYDHERSQCEIAEFTRQNAEWFDYGDVDCCSDAYAGCNNANKNWGDPGSMRAILNNWGINNEGYNSYRSKAHIENE